MFYEHLNNEKKIGALKMDIKITTGLKFRSNWFKGLVTVISFDETTNKLHVLIDPQEENRTSWEEDDWDLQVTKWAFEKGDYTEELSMVTEIVKILSSHRFPLNNEKDTQAAIEAKFQLNEINYTREHRLDPQNIPDFFIDGIAIEIKIKGNAKKIYKQCERYCNFDSVKELILVTNRSMGFPNQINGKPCYFIKLSNAWL